MPFEKFMSIVNGVAGDIKSSAKKFSNSGTRDRAAAVCAMVAYIPDQDADKDEINKGVKAIHKMTDGAFKIEEMVAAVNKAVETLEFDVDMGYTELMNAVRKAGADERRLLVSVGIAVGKSSGEKGEDPFSPEEKDCVRRIISDLGMNSSEFGL